MKDEKTELQEAFDKLMSYNWKVRQIYQDLGVQNAEEALEKWPLATKGILLELLENEKHR